MEAVKRGSAVVGVVGSSCVLLAVERRATPKLQDSRTVKKILQIDEHIMLAFAGLTADARVLVQKARLECQNHRLTLEDAPTITEVSNFLARTQQKYTQRGGVRPFGLTAVVAGFERGRPKLFVTDPAGTVSSWKANAVGGRNEKSMREYLEKSWKEDLSQRDTAKLAIRSLLEVVDGGAKNMELCVLTPKAGDVTGNLADIQTMSEADVDVLVKEIEKDIEDAKAASAGAGGAAGGGGGDSMQE